MWTMDDLDISSDQQLKIPKNGGSSKKFGDLSRKLHHLTNFGRLGRKLKYRGTDSSRFSINLLFIFKILWNQFFYSLRPGKLMRYRMNLTWIWRLFTFYQTDNKSVLFNTIKGILPFNTIKGIPLIVLKK